MIAIILGIVYWFFDVVRTCIRKKDVSGSDLINSGIIFACFIVHFLMADSVMGTIAYDITPPSSEARYWNDPRYSNITLKDGIFLQKYLETFDSKKSIVAFDGTYSYIWLLLYKIIDFLGVIGISICIGIFITEHPYYNKVKNQSMFP